MGDTKAALATAANEARGLAMDSIAAAHSGHMGLPLGAAEVGAVLYGSQMSYNAEDPQWINRDRFILSAGHGSMFIYSWLNLAGYDLPMDELKQFRQYHSQTPGHPEFPNSEHTTPGIECTTGSLGAGVSNAVGHAVSEKIAAAISAAKANKNGKPKFIKCNTIIGKGMEETEGTNAAHGEAGVPYVDKTKIAIGIPEGEKWYVSQGTRDYFKTVQEKNKKTYDAWQANFKT